MVKVKDYSMTHSPEGQAKQKILVVEDNELNLKLFRDLLLSHDYEVVETNDGNQALELVRQHMPHLILMDIQLHGLSGYDVIVEIKKEQELRHIPIIAVTAFAMQEDREKILASGCEAYIAKPISIRPFLETIGKLLKANDES